MQILVRESQTVLADLTFEDETVTIGSEATCNVHLPDSSIGPRNAQISPAENGDWILESLDYSSPVLVNGVPLTEKVKLKHGDELAFRHYVLTINLIGGDLDEKVVEDPRLSPEELAKIRDFPLPPGSTVKRRFDAVNLTLAQLEQVARATIDLVHCRDIHEVVELSQAMLLKAFDARVAWIGIRRKAEGELEILGGKFRSGEATGTTPIIELLQYRCLERSQHVCVRKVRDNEQIGTAMAVPLMTRDGTLGMIYVDRAPRTRRFQTPDLDLLTAIGAHVATKVHDAVSERVHRTAQVWSTEVSVAHKIQAQLDPKSSPTWKNYLLAAYSRSGQQSPGDVYDVMKHPDGELTAFLLGHVNATGASLALSMARLHSTFRVAFLHKDSPQAFNRELNWLMYDESDPATIDTICILLDPPSGRFKYSRAGRIGALVVNAQGAPRRVEGADGPAIGRVRNYEYVSKLDAITPGESLVLYSRGVASATNEHGERFGENRFIQLIADGFDETPTTVIQDVTHELTSFFAGGQHLDDITIVLLRRLS